MTDWVNEPVLWRKATWTPWGAGGLPEVKPLLLPEMPEPPVKAQGEPVGSYWKWPVPTTTCSKPGSPIEGVAWFTTWETALEVLLAGELPALFVATT